MNDDLNPSLLITLDRAIAELQRMPTPKSPGLQLLLARLPIQFQSTRSDQTIPQTASNPWNFLMRYIYQFTIAAVALLVPAIGWFTLASPTPVAPIQPTTNHKIVRYKLNTSAEIKMKMAADRPEQFVPSTSEEVVYFDLTSPRFRVERHEKTLNNTVQSDWVTVQDNKQDRTLVTSSTALIVNEADTKDKDQIKAIKLFNSDRATAGKIARLYRISDDGVIPFTNLKTDKTFLEILQTLQDHNGVVATNDKLGGREAKKYQLNEPGKTSIVWVDLGTKLPIRIEQEMLSPRPNVKRWKWTYTDFAWDFGDVNLNEFFSTTPAAGYKVEDHTKDK